MDLNYKIYPHTSKVIFTGDVLLDLAQEYAEIPEAESTDFPGIPVVTSKKVFEEDTGGEEE